MKQKLVLWSFINYIANILNLKSYLLFGGGTTQRLAKDIRKNKVVVFLRDPEKDLFSAFIIHRVPLVPMRLPRVLQLVVNEFNQD